MTAAVARAYYNDNDAFCCAALRTLIAEGALPAGDVDERDVREVDPSDLEGYGQIHLFAGIGGGGLACRLARVPDDFPVITAGVPCQPASQAGKRLGAHDERWLWPEFFRLLRALRFHYAVVEQPPGITTLNAGREWRWILGQLATLVPRYQVSRVSAADVGAPQERDRVWIVADPGCAGLQRDDDARGARASAREDAREAVQRERRGRHAGDRRELVGDADGEGRPPLGESERAELERPPRLLAARPDESVGDADEERCGPGRVHRSGVADEEWPTGRAARGPDEDVGDATRGGRRAGRALAARRVDGGCESVVDPDGVDGPLSGRRDESERADLPARRLAAEGRSAGVGDASGAGREERVAPAEPTRARHAARERGRLDPWSDAVAIRGADGTVRLLPREAAETGPESPLWPVAPGLPGRVARLRAIGNSWCPQAAVPALELVLRRAAP